MNESGLARRTITTACSTAKGRVWFAAAVRGPNNPDFCKKGSDHPSAKVFPIERTNRHLTMLDPKTMKYTFVDTCFGTHHLQFVRAMKCCGPAAAGKSSSAGST